MNMPIGTAILLQIVMVSPGTHFVKNHEAQSRSNESQLKKKITVGLYRVMSLLHKIFVDFKYYSSQ